MTTNERELIQLVRDSENPEKTMMYMIDIMTRFLKGESIDEIKAHCAIG